MTAEHDASPGLDRTTPPRRDEIAAVQRWMTLDLFNASGFGDYDFNEWFDRLGFAIAWAELNAHVRRVKEWGESLSAERDQLRARLALVDSGDLTVVRFDDLTALTEERDALAAKITAVETDAIEWHRANCGCFGMARCGLGLLIASLRRAVASPGEGQTK